MPARTYRGRLAPSPTGYLHIGHAKTFWTAFQRAKDQHGRLVLRNEDLDPARSRGHFLDAIIEDLRWLGLSWDEGPESGGDFGPYSQSERYGLYEATFQQLRECGFIYPCRCSRRDVQRALQAPHQGDEEPVYPGTCRPNSFEDHLEGPGGERVCWRFRVNDGEKIDFLDGALGPQQFVAGRDFGDFVLWRQDNAASYQLAVVVDDAAMEISEVVRGADLLVSTARQLLLYRALGLQAPAFYHCPLVTDEKGARLAKRTESLSLRALREQGFSAEDVRKKFLGLQQ